MVLPDDITVRLVRLDDEDLPPWQDLLADYECRRLESFKSVKRRRMFVQGRVAARLLLAERLGMEPASVPLRLSNGGAPFVEGSDLHISIGHAGCYGLAAAGPVSVGVDIEAISRRNPQLYRYMLEEADYDLLETLPVDHDRRQILVWALKESVLKSRGSGLRISPKKVRLDIDFDRCSAVATLGRQAWTVRFKEHEGFFLAVAYAAS